MTYEILDPRHQLPPGDYYIGDPCYVIPRSEWTEALDATRYFNLFPTRQAMNDGSPYNPREMMHGVFCRGPWKFAVSSTEYGDGCYPCEFDGQTVGRCGVDAGMVAAVPVELVRIMNEGTSTMDRLESLGCVVTIRDRFGVEYDEGTIRFGPVEVLTGDDAWDDEDDGWGEEE